MILQENHPNSYRPVKLAIPITVSRTLDSRISSHAGGTCATAAAAKSPGDAEGTKAVCFCMRYCGSCAHAETGDVPLRPVSEASERHGLGLPLGGVLRCSAPAVVHHDGCLLSGHARARATAHPHRYRLRSEHTTSNSSSGNMNTGYPLLSKVRNR